MTPRQKFMLHWALKIPPPNNLISCWGEIDPFPPPPFQQGTHTINQSSVQPDVKRLHFIITYL
jgi:hypothetical protein